VSVKEDASVAMGRLMTPTTAYATTSVSVETNPSLRASESTETISSWRACCCESIITFDQKFASPTVPVRLLQAASAATLEDDMSINGFGDDPPRICIVDEGLAARLIERRRARGT